MWYIIDDIEFKELLKLHDKIQSGARKDLKCWIIINWESNGVLV